MHTQTTSLTPLLGFKQLPHKSKPSPTNNNASRTNSSQSLFQSTPDTQNKKPYATQDSKTERRIPSQCRYSQLAHLFVFILSPHTLVLKLVLCFILTLILSTSVSHGDIVLAKVKGHPAWPARVSPLSYQKNRFPSLGNTLGSQSQSSDRRPVRLTLKLAR